MEERILDPFMPIYFDLDYTHEIFQAMKNAMGHEHHHHGDSDSEPESPTPPEPI